MSDSEVERATVERMAAALALVLHDAHPTYASTAGWRGGIGGQTMTTGCSIKDPPPGAEWTQYDLPSRPLREWLALHPEFNLTAAKAELRRELQSEVEW